MQRLAFGAVHRRCDEHHLELALGVTTATAG